MARVALLFDFDGTLSPINVPREKAGLSEDMVKALEALSEKYVLGIVSSKDCHFLKKKLPRVVQNLACANGLEITAAGYLVVDELAVEKKQLTEAVLEEARGLGVEVEVKKSLLGFPLGLSIDWGYGREKPVEVSSFLSRVEKLGFYVLEYPGYWFADVYPSRRSKGDAIRVLKALLGLDKVVYFGDSVSDIPAFAEANVAVLVEHEYNRNFTFPRVNYRVGFKDLPRWLLRELDNLA